MIYAPPNSPAQPIRKWDPLTDDWPPPEEHQYAPLQQSEPAPRIITAIRIPTDGALPDMIDLELVKATSEYHFIVQDSTLLHHTSADSTSDSQRCCSKLLDPTADNTQVNIDHGLDSEVTLSERTVLARLHHLNSPCNEHKGSTYGGSGGVFLDAPLAEKSEEPHMTFTNASLRYQPNVVDEYWKSEEAWKQRCFQRLYAVPREDADLDMMMGEYHIMYTKLWGQGLRPNKWSELRIFGDVFVLKMASEKNDKGDWYYVDIPPEILHSSLGPQCLETLCSLRPVDYKTMVGERGGGPPGVISPGRGLPGNVTCVMSHESMLPESLTVSQAEDLLYGGSMFQALLSLNKAPAGYTLRYINL